VDRTLIGLGSPEPGLLRVEGYVCEHDEQKCRNALYNTTFIGRPHVIAEYLWDSFGLGKGFRLILL